MQLDAGQVAEQVTHLSRQLGGAPVRWAAACTVVLRLTQDDSRPEYGGVLAASDEELHYYRHADDGASLHERLPLAAVESCVDVVLRVPSGDLDAAVVATPINHGTLWALIAEDDAARAELIDNVRASALAAGGTLHDPYASGKDIYDLYVNEVAADAPAAPVATPASSTVAASAGGNRGARRLAIAAATVAVAAIAVVGVLTLTGGEPATPDELANGDQYQDITCHEYVNSEWQYDQLATVRVGAAKELGIDPARVSEDRMWFACADESPDSTVGETVARLSGAGGR